MKSPSPLTALSDPAPTATTLPPHIPPVKPHRIIWTLVAILALILVGILGYMGLEGFTFIEALYMSIITLTSVGFGEVHPLSDTGRLFTTGYIVMGFSGLAFASHALVGSSMAGATIEEVSRQMGTRIFGLRRAEHDTIFPGPELSLRQPLPLPLLRLLPFSSLPHRV